jgi:hypothetical protein
MHMRIPKWAVRGLTVTGRYNRYLAVAARTVRRSLKEDKRLQAERRGEMDLRFAKWEVCRLRTPMKSWTNACGSEMEKRTQ